MKIIPLIIKFVNFRGSCFINLFKNITPKSSQKLFIDNKINEKLLLNSTESYNKLQIYNCMQINAK